jgi:hypothetical protein
MKFAGVESQEQPEPLRYSWVIPVSGSTRQDEVKWHIAICREVTDEPWSATVYLHVGQDRFELDVSNIHEYQSASQAALIEQRLRLFAKALQGFLPYQPQPQGDR